MKNKIKFSVIVPIFNRPNKIKTCLKSVINQTYKEFEIILVDDGSNTKNKRIIKKIAKNLKIKKIVFHKKNYGPSAARNSGWKIAQGDYIAFLDSDDTWHKEKLNICSRFLKKEKSDGCFHNYSLQKANEQYKNSQFHKKEIFKLLWLFKNFAVTPSLVVNKNCKVRFNPKIKRCEDYLFLLNVVFSTKKFFKIEGPPLCQIDRPLYTKGGLSQNLVKMRFGEIQAYYYFCNSWQKKLFIFPLFLLISLLKAIILFLKRKTAQCFLFQ